MVGVKRSSVYDLSLALTNFVSLNRRGLANTRRQSHPRNTADLKGCEEQVKKWSTEQQGIVQWPKSTHLVAQIGCATKNGNTWVSFPKYGEAHEIDMAHILGNQPSNYASKSLVCETI